MIRNRVATSSGTAWRIPSESHGEISGIGILCSCAPTIKFNNSYTRNEISQDYVTINVHRICGSKAGAFAIGIQDGNKNIGEIGPDGELTWRRPAGYVALIASTQGIYLTHAIIFRAEAGKTYSFSAELAWSNVCAYIYADNPSDTSIIYKEETSNFRKEISDKWKSELVRLKSLENTKKN